jgi:glycosyltransferase involved in cell wall biosynthesis
MVSIIIPVFNEEKSVKNTLERVFKVCEKTGEKFEVITVNDGSRDNSLEVLNAIKKDKESNFKVINHLTNKGYGASLKDGIIEAKYDNIVICDADGTYPIEKIPELLSNLENNDMVVGKRVGRYLKTPLIKSVPKFILDQVANIVVGRKIEDINSGFRVFKKSDIEKYFLIISDKFSFTTTSTLSYMSNNLSVKYIPIEYNFREGKSKVKPKDASDFLFLIIRTVMYFNPLRVFFWPSVLFMFLGIGKFVFDLFNEPYLNITTSAMLFFLSGLQLLAIGMLADLIVRTRK